MIEFTDRYDGLGNMQRATEEELRETITRLEGELKRVNDSYDADMTHWRARLTASEAGTVE